MQRPAHSQTRRKPTQAGSGTPLGWAEHNSQREVVDSRHHRLAYETLVGRQVVEADRSSRAASRSDARTRISRGPAAVNSSSDESIASVSRYAQSMPADLSNPQTTSASGPPDTTVKTTPSPGSMHEGYSTPRWRNGVPASQPGDNGSGARTARSCHSSTGSALGEGKLFLSALPRSRDRQR